MAICSWHMSLEVTHGSENGCFGKWPLWPWPLRKTKNAWYVHHFGHVVSLHSKICEDRFIGKCARAGRILSLAKISVLRKRTTFNPLTTVIFDRYLYNSQVICVLARGINIRNYVNVSSKGSPKRAIKWFLTYGYNDLDLWPWPVWLTKIDTLYKSNFTYKIWAKSVH